MARHLQRQIPVWVCTLLALVSACSGAASDDSAGNRANAIVANAAAPAPAENAIDAGAATNTAATAPPYHANGTEPFWALTIAGGQITYQPMEGAGVTEPVPAQTSVANGYRYVGSQLTVEVLHTACNNGMSEETFADTVHVTVGGETRNGCGGQSDGVHQP